MNSEALRAAIEGCAESHHHLLAGLIGLRDDHVTRASLLPGWTVGHVLTHLARNADGLIRMVEGARNDEVLDQYAGGAAGRANDIESGAVRSAAALVDDVRATAERLDTLFAACAGEVWDRRGRTMAGDVAIRELPSRRRVEVEVHRVDLGLGYTFADWPSDFQRSELVRMTQLYSSRKPMGFGDLPPAALALAPADRLAWLYGRADIPGLAAAGIF